MIFMLEKLTNVELPYALNDLVCTYIFIKTTKTFVGSIISTMMVLDFEVHSFRCKLNVLENIGFTLDIHCFLQTNYCIAVSFKCLLKGNHYTNIITPYHNQIRFKKRKYLFMHQKINIMCPK